MLRIVNYSIANDQDSDDSEEDCYSGCFDSEEEEEEEEDDEREENGNEQLVKSN
ncbi:hypothetical protein TTHERM_01284750 (macronuclear) [Tetrahymena thermophila SB210]|uniref:Uncharacterized protein n=1 Tax=Tetrahymena thermophila (strain SB210) TaxID=312017 RepID=Q24HS0_TETTS|nr:hypothetical protein TTHERM_01284750 [Tetrahymena thermophila SB210]EAS07325.1 hypothetical protein TTHERM_01284750 [Tetrahymena thermophila SB210]|eukprot:XP_001027567.1 hypothetical protein TTHERM_01284750 [Tetrahymena thermophila SB210]